MSDPTVEAEQVAHALRRIGYGVVDVPLSMLVARVAVQRPRLILVDSDAEGALDVVARMRELPEADDIHVVYLGRPGGPLAGPEDAIAHDASGLFFRPVDVDALIRKVELLTGRAPQEPPPPAPERALAEPADQTTSPPTSPPTSPGQSLIPRSSHPPSLPPASMRSASSVVSDKPPSDPTAGRPSKAPSDPPSRPRSDPPTAASYHLSRKGFGVAPPLSDELKELLAEAERRIQVRHDPDSVVPSPEEEIEAVLPAELLAVLDEPLEEEDDDEEPLAPGRHTSGPPASLERTGEGALARTTGATTGSGATPGASHSPKPVTGEDPITHPPSHAGSPHTPAGTHGGNTGPGASDTGSERIVRNAVPPSPPAHAEPLPAVVGGAWESMRLVGRCVSSRMTGTLLLAGSDSDRRIVLREGDVVTASSASEDESLLAFLWTRGDLPRETVRRLGAKFPPSGRHAGAALVARGYLRQDQMWPTLRAHAEWVLARALQTSEARVAVEETPPGRLAAEPSVFGGSTGAEVFVDLVRRVVAPASAIDHLGGLGSRLAQGACAELLGECSLGESDLEQVRAAGGHTLRDALAGAPDSDLPTVVLALVHLGVLDVLRGFGERRDGADDSAPDISALDAEAIRERVRARLELVQDGNYFAVLGVSKDATGYEIRRAFLELRRTFEPARLITPDVADLAEDVRTIVFVLEEAYDVLRDAARRERYRRALDTTPENLT